MNSYPKGILIRTARILAYDSSKEKKTDAIKKHSKYFQNKFCIHSITFQAVKIYFKNKLCLINVTTAKPYYAYGVQGNLALFNLDI